MKLFLSSLILVFAGHNALAAESKDICARFMKCGTFVDLIDKNDPKGGETKIVIASTGDLKGTFDYIVIDKEGKTTTWPLVAEFTEEGVGILRYGGQSVYATVICKYDMCNYALVPFKEKKDIWGNAGLMRFTDDGLEFMMTVGVPRDFHSSKNMFTKQ